VSALGSSFSTTLLQLSFPAALQLISIFIPLLYLLKQDERLKHNIFSRSRVLFPLALAVGVSLLLYTSSVVLLLSQSSTLDHEVPLMASSIPVIDIVVVFVLACFLAIPFYFIFDMFADLRRYRERLPQSLDSEGIRPIISRLAANSRAVYACRRHYRIWRGALEEFQYRLEPVQQGLAKFEAYLEQEKSALCSAAAQALVESADEAQSILTRVFLNEHRRTTEECMHIVYGTHFASRLRRTSDRLQPVANALAAAALILVKYELDQDFKGARAPGISGVAIVAEDHKGEVDDAQA
jgi:hypothetical protein